MEQVSGNWAEIVLETPRGGSAQGRRRTPCGVWVDTFCNSGDVATGGGFESFSPVLEVRSSTPLPPQNGDDPNGWRVNVRKTDTVEEPTVSVFVVCQHTE